MRNHQSMAYEGLPGNRSGAVSSSHAHTSHSTLGFLGEHRTKVHREQSITMIFLHLKKKQKSEPKTELSEDSRDSHIVGLKIITLVGNAFAVIK